MSSVQRSDSKRAAGNAADNDVARRVRRGYVLLFIALVVSVASLTGHYAQPMGSYWRGSDGELVYTGIRPPLWKTYHFPPLGIEAMGIVPDPESPGGEVFAIAAEGVTMKLVDLNAESIPGFDSYVADVQRLALALREGDGAPPVIWIHWTNMAVALGSLLSVVLWIWAFAVIWRVRPASGQGGGPVSDGPVSDSPVSDSPVSDSYDSVPDGERRG